MTFTIKDLIIPSDYLKQKNTIPRPFIGMLLKVDSSSTSAECIIIGKPKSMYGGSVCTIDNLLNGYFNPGHQLSDYGCNFWKIPGKDYFPSKESIRKWCKALKIISGWDETPQKSFCLFSQKMRGFSYKENEWVYHDEWDQGSCLPVPTFIKDLVFSENNIVQSGLTLKQQNTDGRNSCALCGGTIKKLLGFRQNYNHCPKCEG